MAIFHSVLKKVTASRPSPVIPGDFHQLWRGLDIKELDLQGGLIVGDLL